MADPQILEVQIQHALAAEKISASVHSTTYGETDGCGRFHPVSLGVEVTLQVKRFSERDALAARATQVAAIVQKIEGHTRGTPAFDLPQIIFVANNATCRWDAEHGACQT